MSLQACTPEQLLERARRAGLVPADFVLEQDALADSQVHSAAEAIASLLRLNEDQLYTLLALEYSLEAMPQELIASMEIPEELRDEMQAIVYRREGFAPVDRSPSGRVLVAVSYPFTVHTVEELEKLFGKAYECVLCTDRALASIFSSSVTDEETVFGNTEEDEGFYLGSEEDETMFPGLYGGGSAADMLYDEQPVNQEGGSKESAHTMKGNVADLGLLDMLQMMSQSRKSGTLVIKSDMLGEIYIFFSDGRIVHCITEYGSGEEGFYRIVGIQEGDFELAVGPVEVDESIQQSTDSLILEGLRRLDEANA